MPRKSAAAMAVLPGIDRRSSRIEPRADAPAIVAEIFRNVVASVPATHFRACDADLVEQFAQSVALARRAYLELETGGLVIGGKPSVWNGLLQKAHRNSIMLAARLRLCPQGRADPKTVGRALHGYDQPSAYETMAND